MLEVESPEPGAHDPVHTFEITDLHTRTHQFKSVKSVLQVCDRICYLAEMGSILYTMSQKSSTPQTYGDNFVNF